MSNTISSLVFSSNTRKNGVNEKGQDVTIYTFSSEEASKIVSTLSEILDSGKEKAFLEVRTSKKEVESQRNPGKMVEIDSSFVIVREAYQRPTGGAGAGASRSSAAGRTAALAKSVSNG